MWMMMMYLTNVWESTITSAAMIINMFWGLVSIMRFPMQYIVDTFMGNYWMLTISSLAYSSGLGCLTLSTPPVLAKATSTCSAYEFECLGSAQIILFLASLVLIGIGMCGHLVSLGTFIAEQIVEEVLENSTTRSRFTKFVGSYIAILISVGGVLAISFIKLWSIRFGIPAICTVVATIIFLSGSCSYNCVRPQGSSLTTVLRVLVAATSKIFHKRPSDANQLYEKCGPDIVLLPHSRRLRCLDKAAIIQPTQPLEEQEKKRWKLCTVTEVENTKLSLHMIPLCATLIFCGVVSSIGNTHFIEQANQLNHKVGRLSIPTVILFLFYNQGKQQFANLYYKIANLLGGSRSRKYAPTIGIGVSMIFAILCCVTAAKVEIRRLDVVKSHGLIDKPDERIPMSIFWLLPQFILVGAPDGILESSISDLLINQVGPSMVRYAIHSALGVIGLGNIGGVLSVHEVGKVSERGGSRPSWFHDTLNKSRLDKYYWTLAWLSSVNLGAYIVVTAFYRYRELKLEDDQETPTYDESAGPFEDNARYCCC
ncbi:protein NRT1/ PTR FAMILY 5.5-like isoform X2 [Actinidia eriantha]|nr:protein NRT1/ PTR FAMILY 5.5-like isoform X2 [Actinidia eriantha]